MMRVGWFRQVHVKSSESQHLRVLLSNRRLLKRKFIDVENEVRGTLKAFGIKVGKVSRGKFEARTLEVVAAAQPLLQDLVRGMLAVRRMLWTEYSRLHNMLIRIVRRDVICRRFMSVPGVGPVTALAFKTAVDDSPLASMVPASAEPVEMHGPPLSADAVAHESKSLRALPHRCPQGLQVGSRGRRPLRRVRPWLVGHSTQKRSQLRSRACAISILPS